MNPYPPSFQSSAARTVRKHPPIRSVAASNSSPLEEDHARPIWPIKSFKSSPRKVPAMGVHERAWKARRGATSLPKG
jgi:hypothetical protein